MKGLRQRLREAKTIEEQQDIIWKQEPLEITPFDMKAMLLLKLVSNH